MMTKEAFVKEIEICLSRQLLRYPAMEQEDAVKLVFQGMLGVGHLLSSREAVERYIASEMSELRADPEEPLIEILSPSWCRLNLRRAAAEHIRPADIADMMFASKPDMPFSRQDVYDFCAKLAASDESRFRDIAALDAILDDTVLPSHSAAYRTLYHPAYRVISTKTAKELFPVETRNETDELTKAKTAEKPEKGSDSRAKNQ